MPRKHLPRGPVNLSAFATVGTRSTLFLVLFLWGASGALLAQPEPPVAQNPAAIVSDYCFSCHDSETKKGELDLETISGQAIADHAEIWEKALRRVRTRQMPPPGKRRPDEATYHALVSALSGALDAAAAKNPNPGRTETFRRLNRTEYQNAIRDLLDLEIDAAALLPKDEASHGFDNVTVGDLSPTLLDRYISAAEKISKLAVGRPTGSGGETFRIRPDLTQEEHVEGLPYGTRGGAQILHTFPVDGEYEIQVRLTRDRNEEVEGLRESHEMVLLLDRKQAASFTLKPPSGLRAHETADEHLKIRLPIKAGPQRLGVTFLKNPSSLLETKRQPYNARFNMHRHPRTTPAVYQVSINGPFTSTGPGDSPSRRKIFVEKPADPSDADRCAKSILATLMRRAFRRPVTEAELAKPMQFFRRAEADEGFEAGIESALAAILVSPNFLFRIESDPAGIPANTAYRISDLELASRLSFFLWSSIPDDELLDAATAGDLKNPALLEKQVRRMMADPRSEALARNFAGQWLHLRNLDSFTPDLRLFPDFDDNLRQGFRRETELFFSALLREDRPALDLIRADFTFLNERLAKHYGIPHVYGSRFRRISALSQVKPENSSARGGLLRQGSVLTVTSYANRTSPVIRGHWILANFIGTPPPPPPGNVPALKENSGSSSLSVRERLAEHRANSACASCHNMMDPVGFALENFDAVGRWRTMEEGKPVDNAGGLPDGSQFYGVSGLEQGLLNRPEIFVGTFVEKLLTFALGRGIGYEDAPAIRKIVQKAEASDYRFSAIIAAIAQSQPFTMRRTL